MPEIGKWLGRKPDKPDGRDLVLRVQQAAPLQEIGAPLPDSVDVFSGLSLPVYDQGSLGSCTANAGVLYRRVLARRFNARGSGVVIPGADQDLSRLFLYYQERRLPWNDDVNSDSGASIRDVFYVLAHTGVCPDEIDPYVLEDFASATVNDNPADLSDAQPYRIGAYHRIPDVTTAKSVLASGYPVALGITVYTSFDAVGPDGTISMPLEHDPVWGGHALVIRGYDDSRGAFFVQNSWGESWGAGGCCWLPYEYVDRADISQPDMWMGHLGKPWKAVVSD